MSPESTTAALAAIPAALAVGYLAALRRVRRFRAALIQESLDLALAERGRAADQVAAYHRLAVSAVGEVRHAYGVASRTVAAVGVWRSVAEHDTREADAFLRAELGELRQRAEEGLAAAESISGWLEP